MMRFFFPAAAKLKLCSVKGAALSCLSMLFFCLPCFSCKTGPVSTPPADSPGGLFFVSAPLPDPDIPAETGLRIDAANEENALRSAFRDAYREALFRGIPLGGILGGDRVSPWPVGTPQCWSQNWVSADGEPNSFRIPGLVLALGNYNGASGSPVYTVSGPILNLYGKSAGVNRANGAAGYGVPEGEVFYSGGTAVQRFSRGRMIVSREGSRFSFGSDPAAAMAENLSDEKWDKEFGGRDISADVAAAFVYAWAFAFSEREGTSDGPLNKVSFAKPWILGTEGAPLELTGFYYKSYNRGQDVLVLLEGEALPRRVHLLSGPFLQTILSHKRISGLPLGRAGSPAGMGLGRSLAEGFALYGPVLSDALPWPAETAPASSDVSSDASADAAAAGPLYREAQRFSRGWIVVKNAETKMEGTEGEPQ